MSQPTSDRWIGVSDLAEYLGVSSITVYRWLEAGTVPAHKIGKLWRFKASEVDAWVRSGGADGGRRKKNPETKPCI